MAITDEQFNDLALQVSVIQDQVDATAIELGVSPGGAYADVRSRLDILEARINIDDVIFAGDLSGSHTTQTVIGIQGRPVSSSAPIIGQVLQWAGSSYVPTTPPTNFTAGGDLTGSISNQTVIGIQGNPVSSTTPLTGQVLEWTGSHYAPTTLPTGFSAGGDLSGSISNQTVIGLHGHPLAVTTPIDSAVPVWDGSSYSIRQLTLDDLGVAFNITSFSGGTVVECGATVVNPSFTASYSTPANNANITNTDGTDSPLVLSSPFTSGTVIGSFTHSGVNDEVVFTLTAIAATTRMATAAIVYEARSFGGVGSPGASGATASGNNATLVGASGTLSDLGLHVSDAGQVYGPFSPSGQKIYLLLIGSGHSFKDSNGFTFPMNSPINFSFTNSLGAVITMSLYESTNVLSTPFTLTVS